MRNNTELTPFRDSSIRAETIEAAQNLANFPTAQELEDYMGWRLRYPDARDYRYWISDPVSVADYLDLEPPARANLHGDMADFISSKIKITRHPEASDKRADNYLLENYKGDILRKSADVQALIAAGDPLGDFSQRSEFGNLNLQYTRGGSCDLTRNIYVEGGMLAMSNILLSRTFVRHLTPAVIDSCLTRAEWPAMDYRVYLNPRLSRAGAAATELTTIWDRQNLPAITKILNRVAETAGQRRVRSVRNEGMVVYCDRESIDRLLTAALDYYNRNASDFSDRRTPKLATQIAPGLAVATNEGLSGRSFNSHRSAIFESAWIEFQSGRPDSAAQIVLKDVEVFRGILLEKLHENGVYLRNISFLAV